MSEKRKHLRKFASLIALRDGGWHCYYCQRELMPEKAPWCYPYYEYVGDDETIKRFYREYPDRYHANYFHETCEQMTGTWLANYARFAHPTIEHKTPLSRGGTNDPTNLVLSCSRCNARKGKLTVEEFSVKYAEGFWWKR